MIARAAPPAPSTQTRDPATSIALRGERCDEAGAVGAVPLERARRPSGTTVLTLRSAAAAGSSSSTSVGARLPCAASSPTARRCPSTRIASSAAPAVAGRDLERGVHPVEHRLPRRPALCSAGDRLWRTGLPITAASLVVAEITPAARGRGRLHVGLVLLERCRERVPPVLVGEHVVQVVARRVGPAGRRRSGRPATGSGAGFSAAWIDARPGLAIGVGGRPVCR